MISQRVVIQILANVTYTCRQNTGFTHGHMGDGYYIQHWQQIDCANTGEMGPPHTGRKWYISKYMTTSEIVQTALMAILAYEEHEVRERFHYKGERPFGPHVDVEALLDASNYKDVRDEGKHQKAGERRASVG